MKIFKVYFSELIRFSPSGRSSRSEFWSFFVVHLLVCVVLGFPYIVFFTQLVINDLDISSGVFSQPTNQLFAIYYTLSLISTFGVIIRRLHDTNQSGLILLGFVGLAIVMWVYGIIALLAALLYIFIVSLIKGTAGTNRYGDPRDNSLNILA